MAHLLLPDDSIVITPLTATQDIFDGSNFDLRMRVRHTAAEFGTSNETWVRFGTFDQDGFLWRITSPYATFQAFHLGGRLSAPVLLTTLGLAKDADTWVRVVYNGTTLAWYSSTDDTNDDTAVTWGAAKASPAFAPTWTPTTLDPWMIGGESLTLNNFVGRFYRMVWYDATPSKVFDADPSDPTTWTYT